VCNNCGSMGHIAGMCKEELHQLWESGAPEYEKVANQDFYLAEFAPDAGGAVKYTFEDRIMFHGETCLIYKHIHGRHPKVAVLIHDHQPVVAIDRELVWREDGQVVAIVYSYATTGETITVKTYFCSERITNKVAMDRLLQYMVRRDLCSRGTLLKMDIRGDGQSAGVEARRVLDPRQAAEGKRDQAGRCFIKLTLPLQSELHAFEHNVSTCFALPLSFMATPVGAMDQGAPAAADDVFGAARGMAVVLSAAATVHTVGCPILRRAMLETSGDVRTPPSTEPPSPAEATSQATSSTGDRRSEARELSDVRSKCRMDTQKLVDKTCNNCGTMGHIAKDCPSPAQCHCCGATVHEIAACPHREKTCENCGKGGHLKKKCRQDKENEPPRGKGSTKGKGKGLAKTCKNCGVQGHLLRDCHEPSQCHCCGSTVHAVAECPNREKSCELCGLGTQCR
ncbi:unnamed protein product, partial [Cladocopium goreaui]